MSSELCARCGFYGQPCVCPMIPEAREGLYHLLKAECARDAGIDRDGTVTVGLPAMLELLASAQGAEREACAGIAEEHSSVLYGVHQDHDDVECGCGQEIAANIRARG